MLSRSSIAVSCDNFDFLKVVMDCISFYQAFIIQREWQFFLMEIIYSLARAPANTCASLSRG